MTIIWYHIRHEVDHSELPRVILLVRVSLGCIKRTYTQLDRVSGELTKDVVPDVDVDGD